MQVFRSGVYRFVSGYIRVGAFKEKIIFDKSEAYVLCVSEDKCRILCQNAFCLNSKFPIFVF